MQCHGAGDAGAELPLSIRLATMAMHAHKFLEEYAAHATGDADDASPGSASLAPSSTEEAGNTTAVVLQRCDQQRPLHSTPLRAQPTGGLPVQHPEPGMSARIAALLQTEVTVVSPMCLCTPCTTLMLCTRIRYTSCGLGKASMKHAPSSPVSST